MTIATWMNECMNEWNQTAPVNDRIHLYASFSLFLSIQNKQSKNTIITFGTATSTAAAVAINK